MNVLGINGSPRIGGNTDILLDRVLEGADRQGGRAEKVILNGLKFCPCQECEDITGDSVCVIDDDWHEVYKRIENADAIILASPIFFGSISAQSKMMIDRFQCVWRAKYMLKKDIFNRRKKGGFISVQASARKDFFDNAKSIVKNFFAVINVDYKEELFCPGIEEKAAILRYPDILKKAFELGQRITST